jgi:hypothetical protein
MINYNEWFVSYEGAMEFYDSILLQYPKEGYATSLYLHEDTDQSVWWVRGYRFSSCD